MKRVQFALLLAFLFMAVKSEAQTWKQYSDTAKGFREADNYEKAIDYYKMAKQSFKGDTTANPGYAGILYQLGITYNMTGENEIAGPLLVKAKEIQESVLGKIHIDYAQSCHSLAIVYMETEQYKKAEPLFLEAIDLKEKLLGRDNLEVVVSSNALASLYAYTGQADKGLPLFLEVKRIREKILGNKDKSFAEACNNLAVIYDQLGEYEKSEANYLEAKSIFKKTESGYYKNCYSLADLYAYLKRYAEAEPLFIEAMQILEERNGKKSKDYASVCNTVADMYRDMGDFPKAESFYLQAQETRENLFGKQSAEYSNSCYGLAVFYRALGQYNKSELLFIESKEIREKVLTKNSPRYASSCYSLAILYSLMGQYSKAELLCQEAKDIREKIFGKAHPDYIYASNILARIYIDREEYSKAEIACEAARKLVEDSAKKKDPVYEHSLNTLAGLYMGTRRYGEAEKALIEIGRIREMAKGKDHLDYASNAANLAALYWEMGEYEKAWLYFKESSRIQYLNIIKIFQFTSESEKQQYIDQVAELDKKILSFSYSSYSHQKQGFTFDRSLAGRNLILSSSRQIRQAIFNSGDTSARNLYDRWVTTKEKLSVWYTVPKNQQPALVGKLEAAADNLEKELARYSVDFVRQQQQQKINRYDIQQSLKPGEAAIEFAEFQYYNGKRWTDSVYYVAIVLRKDKPEPEMVPLFEKRQLDKLINYKGTSAGEVQLRYFYTTQKSRKTKSIYDIVWKPLEQKLGGIHKIYFSPAGSLHKIAFAALPVSPAELLSDKYQLVQLNTTASVAADESVKLRTSDKISLYGGVQYDADSASIRHAALKYAGNDVTSRSLPDDMLRYIVTDFTFLSGSETEVNEIGKLARENNFDVNVVEGIAATEESFKSLTGKKSPAVLHIATHGYFFPDPKNEKTDQSAGGAFVFIQSNNPLIRSGLVLSGANNAWKGKPVKGVEDGILTAYEVSNMHLPNTKLAVLSACETGLGDIQGSEGVYGLQRAFKMAGVENLVMSLWKVPDFETSEFMQLFYKNLFAKQPIPDAFYNTQTVMKNKYRTEPYKWAAWVLIR
jgi:CHAT domain-containing protein